MKWTEDEIEKVKSLIKNGLKTTEISTIMGRTAKAIRVKFNKMSYSVLNTKPKIIKICIECGNEINNNGLKFCSQSCSATHNNKLRIKKPSRLRYNITCLNCKETKKTISKIFCSQNCHTLYKQNIIKEKIENGDTTLYYKTYKNYLIEKYGCKCMECGWAEINPISGKVPIELEHIDGDSTNNRLENLKLLCPNCHSLTPTYKALNIGKGRHNRMLRYNEGKSF